MEKILIDDPRLTPDMRRVRSGRMQLFYRNAPSASPMLVPKVRIKAPRKELYAKLIDGRWHWVNGCAECNGRPRSVDTYIECEKHDVCVTCGISREDAEKQGMPWGATDGWQCDRCHTAEQKTVKKTALETVNLKEYDESDYRDLSIPVCPHCGSELDERLIQSRGQYACTICGGFYSVELNYKVSYTTKVVGDRVID